VNAPRCRPSWLSPSNSDGADSTITSAATTSNRARTTPQRLARSATALSFDTWRDRSGISGAGCTARRRRLPSIAAAKERHRAHDTRCASSSRSFTPGSSPSARAEIAVCQCSQSVAFMSRPCHPSWPSCSSWSRSSDTASEFPPRVPARRGPWSRNRRVRVPNRCRAVVNPWTDLPSWSRAPRRRAPLAARCCPRGRRPRRARVGPSYPARRLAALFGPRLDGRGGRPGAGDVPARVPVARFVPGRRAGAGLDPLDRRHVCADHVRRRSRQRRLARPDHPGAATRPRRRAHARSGHGRRHRRLRPGAQCPSARRRSCSPRWWVCRTRRPPT
jgi:hypothetical protein